jgi:two-component system NtrC family sensor kinase
MKMNENEPEEAHEGAANVSSPEQFQLLSQRILHYANRGEPRIDFLRGTCRLLLEFSGCTAVELRLKEGDKYYRCLSKLKPEFSFECESIPSQKDEDGKTIPTPQDDSDLERLRAEIMRGDAPRAHPNFTSRGSFWVGDAGESLSLKSQAGEKGEDLGLSTDGDYRSLALLPLAVGDEILGLLQLLCGQRDHFTEMEVELYEGVAQTLGVALQNQQAQAALRERVKELTCLYSIAQVVERRGPSLGRILQGIAGLLPPAWQYPEVAAGRIILDGHAYSTPGFREDGQEQIADIVVKGERRGVVEVVYVERKPELDEGPFLREERNLIDTIARQVALIVERREAEEERTKMEEQLRHADRLATIGQLSAGVAHELNEPLGSILGFAQLVKKDPDLPEQQSKDIERIITASLHAREVIRKLMIFARQMPTRKAQIDLNEVIEEGLYFLESRCAKAGIELKRAFAPDLPKITADRAQVHQVLVNLIVNSIQAMPEGGTLSIQTIAEGDHVSLVVEDSGIGMSQEVLKKMFVPFFTTKDINEGTGLGLSVVHGIVTSHGGSIDVQSSLGSGTRFTVRIPLRAPENEEETTQDD